jgi:hypothetical protein
VADPERGPSPARGRLRGTPANEVGRLIELAQDRGWAVRIMATPVALTFTDAPKLEAQIGRSVRSE